MAAKGPQAPTHKRKRPPTGNHGEPATDKPLSNKKAKFLPGKKPPAVAAGGKPGGFAQAAMKKKNGRVVGGDEKKKVEKERPKSKKEARLHAKDLAEARKKKRKPHYSLQQELASLWEKMRHRHIAKEERSKLISEALLKMKGKIQEIAGSHVSSRVLQASFFAF